MTHQRKEPFASLVLASEDVYEPTDDVDFQFTPVLCRAHGLLFHVLQGDLTQFGHLFDCCECMECSVQSQTQLRIGPANVTSLCSDLGRVLCADVLFSVDPWFCSGIEPFWEASNCPCACSQLPCNLNCAHSCLKHTYAFSRIFCRTLGILFSVINI